MSDLDVAVRARHEACHAVVLLAHGLPCDSVDILEDGHVGGTTWWRPVREIVQELTPVQRANRWAEYIAVALAGYVGTADDDPNLQTSCVQDFRDADEFADLIIHQGVAPTGYEGSLTRDGLRRHASATAGDLLRRLSRHVDHLAAELVAPSNKGKLGLHELNPASGRIYADLRSSR